MRHSKRLIAIVVLLLLGASANAVEASRNSLKIGFLSTLSGPGAGLGIDIRDGFNLAVKQQSGKLGGLATEVIIADDQQKPEIAQQVTEKFLKKDKVDFMTGIVFSNVAMAVVPKVSALELINGAPLAQVSPPSIVCHQEMS